MNYIIFVAVRDAIQNLIKKNASSWFVQSTMIQDQTQILPNTQSNKDPPFKYSNSKTASDLSGNNLYLWSLTIFRCFNYSNITASRAIYKYQFSQPSLINFRARSSQVVLWEINITVAQPPLHRTDIGLYSNKTNRPSKHLPLVVIQILFPFLRYLRSSSNNSQHLWSKSLIFLKDSFLLTNLIRLSSEFAYAKLTYKGF
ncbi:unnamed protein product [Paramecium octaurelia]|uniref:Uncharacterized protein n=1 Tax=Paramecium octaurelia TaxID=43137 RepID=A0A8S1XGD2_PAROT|nr:unnamed protein product [Paramecium octaurelia]